MTAQNRSFRTGAVAQWAKYLLASRHEDPSLIPQNPHLKRADDGDMLLSSQS